MATIITKFSDYTIYSIEYFITQIETELAYRDINGLSNGKIEMINITKEHPLVSFMASSLNETVRNADLFRSGILPAISVTPGNITAKGFTMGQGLGSEIINAAYIARLTALLDQTNKEIQDELLITPLQIETIIGEYNRADAGGLRLQTNEWYNNEEINISVWSDSPDIDILLGNLMDSMLATIQVGFVGDDSKLKDFNYKPTKGLVNFNYGRTLFGSEYAISFTNTCDNFIVYTDPALSGHDFDGTFIIPGEE